MKSPFEKFENYNFILASGSPRRKEILQICGLEFTVKTKETPENYPDNLKGGEIAQYIAAQKARAFDEDFDSLPENTIVIAADTIVYINNTVLGKPKDFDDAYRMLKMLSGKVHTVYTGLCIKNAKKEKLIFASTEVSFRELTDNEISTYINECKPYDKAGAYAVQEWIGAAAINNIRGSYYNVVGLPSQLLYTELINFINNQEIN